MRLLLHCDALPINTAKSWTRSHPDALLTIAVAVAVLTVSFFNGSQSEAAIGGFAIAAWWAAGIALVRAGIGFRLDPLGWLAIGAVAAFAILEAASVIWASDDGLVLVDLCRTLGYLGLLVAAAVGVAPGRGRPLLIGIAAGLVAVAALAVGARMFPGILDGDQTRLALFPDAGGRLGYPIAYWNGLGFSMATLTLLLLWVGSSAAAVRERSLAIGALPLPLLTLYLTGSRGGLLALAVGIVVLVALSPVRSRLLAGLLVGGAAALLPIVLASTQTAVLNGAGDQAAKEGGLMVAASLLVAIVAAGWIRMRIDQRLRVPWVPAVLRGSRPVVALALAAVALFLLVGGPDKVAEINDTDATAEAGRGELAGRFLETGSRERVQLWETAVDALVEEPIHGIGSGAFAFFSNRNGEVGRPVRDAHSLYFESAAELGPLGLVAVLVFFGAAAVAVARRTFGDRDGLVALAGAVAAAGAVGVGLDWLWEIPAVMGLIVVAIGLLVGRATLQREPTGGGQWGWSGRIPFALAAVVGAITIVLAGSFVAGESALEQSQKRTAAEDYPEAASAALDAARLLPLDSRPWLQLGSVQRLAGDREAAAESLREAIELSPEDPRPNALLGLVYAETGDPRADAQVARAEALAPEPAE